MKAKFQGPPREGESSKGSIHAGCVQACRSIQASTLGLTTLPKPSKGQGQGGSRSCCENSHQDTSMIWLFLPKPLGREKHHNFRGHQLSMTTKITAKASNVPEGDNLGNSPSAAPARQHDGQRHPRTCPSKPPTLFPIPVLPAQVRWGWRSESQPALWWHRRGPLPPTPVMIGGAMGNRQLNKQQHHCPQASCQRSPPG